MTTDSAYRSDRRVKPHPDDGTWMVFDDADNWAEYTVAPIGDGLWGARNGTTRPGRWLMAGTFDEVMRGLIGPPRR